MRRMLVIGAILAITLTASASVQIFFTDSTYGLSWPEYAFEPVWPQPPNWPTVTQFPPAMAPATVAPGDTVYVWVKFLNEPNNRKINGLDINMTPADAAAWYILDDQVNETKRWDGAYATGAPEFRTPHKVLVAATADGIRNYTEDNPRKLYKGGTYRTALLGALRYDTPGVYTGQLGAAGISYAGGYSAPTVEFGTVTVTPEPASGLLLLLAGIFPRRR
jgi:hypothetical protein